MLRRSPNSQAGLFSLASASLSALLLSAVVGLAQPINSPTNALGTVGLPFSYQISTTSGATNYFATNLPPGLLPPGTNGLITGLPQVVCTSNSIVSAVNAGVTNSTNVAITINPPASPVLASPLTYFGMQGEPLRFALLSVPNHSNVPTTFSVSGLPAGATLISNVSTNTLYTNVLVTNYFINAASLATNGSFVVPVVTRNAGGTNTNNVTFVISPSTAPVITSTNAATGIVGVPFSFDVTAINSPLMFRVTSINGGPAVSITNGALTNGLSFSNVSSGSYVVGRIFGTPATTNAVTLGLEAINNTLTSATQTITINIGPPQPTVILSQPLGEANFAAGSSFYVNAQAFDRLPDTIVPSSVSFTADGAALPGVIGRLGEFYGVEFFPNSGLPFPFNLEVTAQNSLGQTSSFALPMRQWIPANTFPVIQMLPLLPGPQIQAGGIATLRARASTPSARTTVDRVEFYVNKVFVGASSTVVPGTVDEYQFQWQTPSTAGAFEVSARVISQNGNGTLPPIPPGTVVPVYASVITRSPVVLNTAPGVLPSVSIVAPTNSAQLPLNVATRVVASANVFGGSIQQVQFYVDGRPLGAADNTAPYSVDFTPTSYGTYQLFAIATSSAGLINISPTVTVTVPELQGGNPTVTLNAPSTAKTGEVLTFTADANDADGNIVSVEFLANGAPLPTPDALGNANPDPAAPYRYAFAPGAPGRYELVARATDNSGNVTDSAIKVLTVSVGTPPSATITAPSSSPHAMKINETVEIRADAAAAPGRNIARVEFLLNGRAPLATSAITPSVLTAGPYRFTWRADNTGQYSVVARVTDDLGNITDSAPIEINVTQGVAPTVSITTPTDTDTLTPGVPVTIVAEPVGKSGSVTQVEFFVNGVSVGLSAPPNAPPYVATFTPSAVGPYTLMARVTDSLGNVADSTKVTVNAAAPTGAQPLISLTQPAAASMVVGSELYLNATATNADGTALSGAGSGVTFLVNGLPVPGTPDLLKPSSYSARFTVGSNALYVIQAVATNGAGVKAASGQTTITVNARRNDLPQVQVLELLPGASTVAGGNITLRAQALFPAAAAANARVQFYGNGVLLGESAAPVGNIYSFNWTVPLALDGENVTITARAIADNFTVGGGGGGGGGTAFLGSTISSNTPTVVNLGTGPIPTVNITAPTGSIPVNIPTNINVDASVTGGTIASVEFYLDGVLLALPGNPDLTSPFSLPWTPTAPGVYKLGVVATSATGIAKAASSTVTVTAGLAPTSTLQISGDPAAAVPPALTAVREGSEVAFTFVAKNGASFTLQERTALNSGSWVSSTVTLADASSQAGVASGHTRKKFSIPSAGGQKFFRLLYSAAANYAINQTVLLTATANDSDGRVTRVEFLVNGLVVATQLQGPYTFSYALTTPGLHRIVARVTDDSGNVTESAASSLAVTQGTPPSVSLTTPLATDTLTPGIPVSIVAEVEGKSGTVSQVEFFVNDVSVGGATAQPFLVSYTPPAVGPYAIFARATDSLGNVTDSATRVVSAVAPTGAQPLVVLNQPLSGSRFVAGSSIFLNATATEADGSVDPGMSVKFFVNGIDQAGVTANTNSGQFAVPFNLTQAGTTYSVQAVARQTDGVQGAAAPVNVVTLGAQNPFPQVEILELVAGTPTTAGGTIPLRAQVQLFGADPAQTKVQFFADGWYLGDATLQTDGTYLLNWITPNIAKSYSQVKARVVAPNATVTTGGGGGGQQQQIVYFASVFSSNFLTINTATGVRPSATMLLPVDGSSAGLNQALTLRASAGGSPGVASITVNNGGSGYTSAPTVFVTKPGITSIAVSNGGSGYTSAPTVGFTGGEGTGAVAVAVLGTGASAGKVVRVDITNAGIGYSSAPSVGFTGGGGSGAVASALVDPATAVAVLGTGTNAAKVIRVDITNSGGGYAATPQVTFSGGGGSGAVATANVRTPSIASVQFYVNGNPIGAPIAGQPYETTYIPTSQGTYVFAAVATSTDGLKSQPDSVVVAISSGAAPVVTIANPQPEAKYPSGTTIPISATATPPSSNPNARIVSIQFFVDGVSIPPSADYPNPDTQAPFLAQFQVPGQGPFKLTAIATDNFGNVGAASVSIEGKDQAAGQETFINLTHPVVEFSYSTASDLYLNATVIAPTSLTVGTNDVTFFINGQAYSNGLTKVGNTFGVYWRPSSEDFFTVSAQVRTTNNGINIVSPPQTFRIGELAQSLPSIQMLPLANSNIRLGSTTYLQAKVNGGLSDVDRVDFYADQIFLGSVALGFAADNEDVLALFAWKPATASGPTGFKITARAIQFVGPGPDNSVISTNSFPLVVEGPASGSEPVVTLAQTPIAERNYVIGSELFLNATAVAQGSATINTNSIQFFYRGQTFTRTNGVESSGVFAGTNVIYTARVPVQSTALANFVFASAKDSNNNLGNSGSSQINSAAPLKALPAVQMSAKLPGQPEVAGGFVTLRSQATFPGSSSQDQRVEFYANGAFVGEGTNSTTEPNIYSLQWQTPATPNAFQVNARAVDLNFDTPGGQNGPDVEYYSSVISDLPIAVNTIVGSNPVVSVTFPANNTEVPVNVPTFIRADASVAGSTIKEVRFYADGVQVGDPDASAPYEVAFTPPSPGPYQLYAIAETVSGVIGVSTPTVIVSAVQGKAPTSFLKTSTSATATALVNTNTKVVTGFTNLVGGSGYVTNLTPDVRLVGGTTNTTATASALVGAAGSVTNLVTNGVGSGYTNAPTVVIDPPPVTAGTNSSVLLQAAAGDTDGTIRQVDFLQNGLVVATVTNLPYNFSLSVAAPGRYELVARATDNLGNVTDSPYIVLLARGGTSPTVSITDPVDGSSVTPGLPVTVTANASDSDGSVARVELFVNGVVVGTDTQAPYVFTDSGQFSTDTNTTFTPPSEGQYVIVARAVDNVGNVTDSLPVTVTATAPPVGAPTVQMTQPLGEIYYVDGSSYFLNARITDTPPGTININSVKFTVNGLPVTGSTLGRIGNDYGVRYRPINLFGIDAARAEALDDEGNRGISQPNYTVLSIPQRPLPAVSMLPLLPNTPTNAGGKITLRAEAFFPSTASDEARVEFYANNVYVGTASNDPTDEALFLYEWTTPTNQSSYVVQARAVARNFQTAVGEGNVVRFFGSIISENSTAVNTIPGVAPTVSIFQPTNNQTVNVNQPLTIRANATNSAGTIGKVEFYANGQLVGVDTNAVYEASFTPPSTGLYNLAAIAYTQSGILAISDTVTVNSALGAPPTVTLQAPATAAVGETVTLSAVPTPVGTGRDIKSVEFVVNNIVVATDTTYPYQYEWPVQSPGNYQIQARAIDNVGNVGLSSVETLTTFYAPVVTLTASATNVRQGETVRLRARAFTDEPGETITSVLFVNVNGTPLPSPGANGGPNPVTVLSPSGFYEYFYTASQPGTISLQAIATDTAGNEGESSLVEITVQADASAPIINITSPVTGSQVQLNVPLVITAGASPGQGATITSVQFRVTNPDGVLTTLTPTQTDSPYSVSYTGVTKAGFYNITAQVFNSAGKSNVSNVVVEAILVPPPAPGTNLAFIRDMFLQLFYRLPTENERDYWYDWLGETSETALSPLSKRADMVMDLMGFDTSAQTFVNTSGFWTPPVASYQATSAMALQPFGRLGITPTKTLVENFLAPLAADVALNPPEGRPLPLTGTYSFIPDAPYGATYGMAAGMQSIFASAQFSAAYPTVFSSGIWNSNPLFVDWLRTVMFAGRQLGDVIQVSTMMDTFNPQSQRQGSAGAFLTKFVVRQAASYSYLSPASAAAEKAFQLKLNSASLKFQLNDSASAFWSYAAAPDYSKPVVEQYIDLYWDAKQ